MWLTGGPIDVEENVWIGAGATILPGVTIGRDSVICRGSGRGRRRAGAELGDRYEGGRASYVVSARCAHPTAAADDGIPRRTASPW